MTNFWHEKSIYDIVRDYLNETLDKIVDLPVESMDEIVEATCRNVTINKNTEDFVADYFHEAIQAINHFGVNETVKLTDYEQVANLMIRKAAKELFNYCDSVSENEGKYKVYSQADVDKIRDELNELSFTYKFERAINMSGETIEGFTYRYLFHVLPKIENMNIPPHQIAQSLPSPVPFTRGEATAYMKRNFEEAMRLLENFTADGYKVNYGDPSQMIQGIIFEKTREIIAQNPYIKQLMEADPFWDDREKSDTIKLDKDVLNKLTDSLHKQQNSIKFNDIDHSKPKKVVAKTDPNSHIVKREKTKPRYEFYYEA